jgi:hypothetical protein
VVVVVALIVLDVVVELAVVGVVLFDVVVVV